MPQFVLDEFRTGIERAAGIGATLVVAHTGAARDRFAGGAWSVRD